MGVFKLENDDKSIFERARRSVRMSFKNLGLIVRGKSPTYGNLTTVMRKQMKLKDTSLYSSFVEVIVKKLGTIFASPEEKIIQQDDETDGLYFIQRGDCLVNITGHNSREH